MKRQTTIVVGEIPVTVLRSRRKTLALTVTAAGEVLARAPLLMSDRAVATFVKEKEAWLNKATTRAATAKRDAAEAGLLTAAEIAALKAAAKAELPARAAFYAEQMGVTFENVTIRLQKTRWGSCSGKGNLNFNALLMLVPPQTRDSVVVHELCHLQEMNHSKRFYALVYAVMPDYDEHHRWLKEHGAALQARVSKDERGR